MLSHYCSDQLYACLIGFFTSQSTIFQLCRDGSSWVEPELSKDLCVLLKDTTQWRRWGWNPQHLGLESSTLTPSHCAPLVIHYQVTFEWHSGRGLESLIDTGLKLRVRNKNLIFLFLNQNICCGYSKEPSQWDGSFEHPKHMFKLMGKKIFTILPWKILVLESISTCIYLLASGTYRTECTEDWKERRRKNINSLIFVWFDSLCPINNLSVM